MDTSLLATYMTEFGWRLPLWAGLAAALFLSLSTSLVLGSVTIAWLRRMGVRDGTNRKVGERFQELKAGKERTPTMGGIFVIGTLLICGVLVLPLTMNAAWIILAVTLANAALGVTDDWMKLTQRKGDGMKARTKLLLQAFIFGAGVTTLAFITPTSEHTTWVPFLGSIEVPLVLLIPFGVFVAIGTSNAVNLSDGLDGLAGGMALPVLAILLAIALASGDSVLAEALSLTASASAWSVAALAVIAMGALLGFLWFNLHPARVFMGDTGSLALGGLLGMTAIALHAEFLLAIVGATFVAEALSVIMQVGYFKLSGGKRIFRCSPLHHHFQFGGMSERSVVRRFWAASVIFCLLGGVVVLAGPTEGGSTNAAPASHAATTDQADEKSTWTDVQDFPLWLRRAVISAD